MLSTHDEFTNEVMFDVSTVCVGTLEAKAIGEAQVMWSVLSHPLLPPPPPPPPPPPSLSLFSPSLYSVALSLSLLFLTTFAPLLPAQMEREDFQVSLDWHGKSHTLKLQLRDIKEWKVPCMEACMAR